MYFKSERFEGYGKGICSFLNTQRKSLLWNVRKYRWINGPRLPNEIFLLDSSATAINSSHVVFVGANAYFTGRRKDIL